MSPKRDRENATLKRAHRGSPARPSPEAGAGLILIAGLLLFSLYFLLVALNIPYDDDVANLIVLGRDFLHGNVLLTGWALTTQNFLTTEVPSYALGILVLGFNAGVIYALTALHWGLIALLVVLLAATDETERMLPRRVLFSISLIPMLGLLLRVAPWLSFGHLVAFIYALAALCVLFRLQHSSQWSHLAAFAVLLVLGLVGDPFMLYFFVIPVVAACVTRLILNGWSRLPLQVLAATLIAWAVSQAALWAVKVSGGVTISGLAAGVVPMSELGSNLRAVMFKILHVFGVNLYGASPLSLDGLIVAVRMLTLLGFVAAIGRAAVKFRKLSLSGQTLLAIVGITLLANIFNPHAASARYYGPLIIFGIIVVAQAIDEWGLWNRFRTVTVAASLVVGLAYLQPITFSPAATEFDDLARQLEHLALHSGYGPYWRSHVITVATEGAIEVRPVRALESGGIGPYAYGANRLDYDSYANFLIIPIEAKSDSGLTAEGAAALFGAPASTHEIPGYGVLLVWDHDISPLVSAP